MMPLFTEMRKRSIRYFHIDYNAPCLPPQILHNHCFQFLLGNTVVPREIEDNGYAFFFGGGGVVGVNKVHYGLCENSDILRTVPDGNETEVDFVFMQPFHVNNVVY